MGVPWTASSSNLWPSDITTILISWKIVGGKLFITHAAKSLQSCPTLCDPIDVSPPGSSVHGISQARVLEWGATRTDPISRAKSYLQRYYNISKINTLHFMETYSVNDSYTHTLFLIFSSSLFLVILYMLLFCQRDFWKTLVAMDSLGMIIHFTFFSDFPHLIRNEVIYI